MRVLATFAVLLVGCGRVRFHELVGDGGPDVPQADMTGDGRTLYMANSGPSGPTTLYNLDVLTGVATPLGVIATGRVTALMRRATNMLLSISYDDGEVREITLEPLSSQVIGTLTPGYVGMTDYTPTTFIAFNENDDLMYEIPYSNVSLGVSLGPVTDAVTTAPIDTNGGALTTHDNTRFLWTNGVRGLYSVSGNLVTSQLMMTTGIPTYVPGIAFLNQTLWGISRETDEVFSINIPAGTVTTRSTICTACPTAIDIDNADLVL